MAARSSAPRTRTCPYCGTTKTYRYPSSASKARTCGRASCKSREIARGMMRVRIDAVERAFGQLTQREYDIFIYGCSRGYFSACSRERRTSARQAVA